ncbi:MAG: hypothetical protein HW386_434, partial [Gammaproteobacteria bacterium]|nr:hypothetical protein [Gammaproteobacteria bacterium]
SCGVLPRRWDRIQFVEHRFALGRDASKGVYPQRYSTERATKPQGKRASARRVAALLACGVVARRVTELCGYAPLLAPSHKPRSPQQTVFYSTVWGVSAGKVTALALARPTASARPVGALLQSKAARHTSRSVPSSWSALWK